MRELLELFLETAPRCLAAIDAALAADDAGRPAAKAHGLKGICLTIGAEGLAAACRAVEEAGRQGDLPGARAGYAPVCFAWERLRTPLESHVGASP